MMNNAKGGTYNIGSTAPSADVFNVMSQGIEGYKNDDYTKTVERLKARIAANPYDVDAKLELAKYTAEASGQKWTPAEETAAREDVTAQVDNKRRIDTAGVTEKEAGAKTAEATAEQTELTVEEAKKNNLLRGEMTSALSEVPPNTDRAAQLASMAGMTATAKMLEGKTELFDKDKVAMTSNLRKEYNALNKDYISQRDAFGRMMSTVQGEETLDEKGKPTIEGTPAGDLALIFNYMKILDPGSVVRESEFQNAAATGSLDTRIQGYVNQVMTGKRLTGEQRADFIRQAKELYNSALMSHRGHKDTYTLIAERSNLDIDQIATDLANTDRVVAMMDGTLDADAEIRKKYITQARGSASTFGNMIGQYDTIEELEAAQREARGDTGQGGAGGDGAGQAETLNPNRKQLSSGRWVVPDGIGGWKDE